MINKINSKRPFYLKMKNEFLVKMGYSKKCEIELWMESERLRHTLITKRIISNWL